MASIAGVKFGVPCDHLLRHAVTLHWDAGTETFWTTVYANIDVAEPNLRLYINDELFVGIEPVIDPDDPHYVSFPPPGEGFGFGGFGQGGFGQGGFNLGINIPELGQYPVDEAELEFRVIPLNCPKCYLTDADGKPMNVTSVGAITASGFGAGGFGDGNFGG